MRRANCLSLTLWIMGALVVASVPLAAQEPAQELQAQDPQITVPPGTLLPVILNTYLNTRNTQVGDVFYADTSYPIWIQQRLVIPRGSIIKGTVTAVNKPGWIKGKGSMTIRFDSILLPNGVERQVVANFHGIHGPGAEKIDRKTETVEQGGTGSNPGEEVGTVVASAGQGSIIGAVASRGTGGTLIGAGAGAAAGVVTVLLSRDRNLVLETGTQLDLQLEQPLRFAYGEIIFTQSELDSAGRTSVARPVRKLEPSRSRIPRLFRLPGIRRWR